MVKFEARKERMMFTEAQTKMLQAKLNPGDVKPAKSFGPKGDYIEGWHAIAEANRIFGFDGWSYEIHECKCVSERARGIGKDQKPGFGVTYTAKVTVSVEEVRREDFGAGHGYDVDCGLAHESAIKEAITDALKRALRTFGNPFGLALYDKSRENVGFDAPEKPAADAPFVLSALSADYQAIYKSMRGNKTPDDLRAWWKDDECKTWRAKLTLPELDKLRAEFATFGSNLAARQEATQTPFDDETARINDELSKSPLGAG
jgi:DNA recombination protein Rad52